MFAIGHRLRLGLIGGAVDTKLAGHAPSTETKRAFAEAIRVVYGLLVAAGFAAVRGGRRRRALRDGALFGAASWLVGSELAIPLLGLADKPTAYHPTYHASSLAQHQLWAGVVK